MLRFLGLRGTRTWVMIVAVVCGVVVNVAIQVYDIFNIGNAVVKMVIAFGAYVFTIPIVRWLMGVLFKPPPPETPERKEYI